MSQIHRFTDNNRQELFSLSYKRIRIYLFVHLSMAINDEMAGNTYASSLIYRFKPYDIISIANGTSCENFLVDKDLYVIPFDGDKLQFIPADIMPLIVSQGIQKMTELMSLYTVKTYDFSMPDKNYHMAPVGILFKRSTWKFNIQMSKKVNLIIMSTHIDKADSRELVDVLTVKERDVNIKTKSYKFNSVYISYAYARGETEGVEVASIKDV